MGHHISIVEDDELPPEHDFVFLTHPAGAHIFYRDSTLTEAVLEDSWTAYRAILNKRGPSAPTRVVDVEAVVVELATREAG